MPQETILPDGATKATSTDVTVAAGAHVYLGIFAATGNNLSNCRARVLMDTPGLDCVFYELHDASPVIKIIGPGVWRVERQDTGASCGVWSDT